MKSNRIAFYDLPKSILQEIKEICLAKQVNSDTTNSSSERVTTDDVSAIINITPLLHFTCSMCRMEFESLEEQKVHFKSKEHLLLLQQSLHKQNEESDSSDSENEDSLSVIEEGCLLSLRLSTTYFTVYKRLLESSFSNREVTLTQFPNHLNGHYCIILYRSGYFILGIYRQGKLLLSRQEKRYTTRRKQGGAQKKTDNSTGKAKSMGAQLRRHNEVLMQQFVKRTLHELQADIDNCSLVFLGTTKANIPLFFEDGCLRHEDSRIRKVPLFFSRPNLNEINRVYQTLVTGFHRELKTDPVEGKDEKEIEYISIKEIIQDVIEKPIVMSMTNEEGDHHNEFWNAISSGDCDKLFLILQERPHYTYLWNADGETALHVASEDNDIPVLTLLLACGSDPTVRDESGRLAYPLCSNKQSRNVYIEYRGDHQEQWDYSKTAIPEPLSIEQKEKQKEKQREKQKEKKRKQRERKKEKENEGEGEGEIEREEKKGIKDVKEMTKEEIKNVNDQMNGDKGVKLSMAEQMKLTNQLHQLASRLRITYRDLVSYLSKDGTSIKEKANHLNYLLDSGSVPVEVILEDMFGF